MSHGHAPEVEGEGGEGGEAEHDEADAVLAAGHRANAQRQRHSHLRPIAPPWSGVGHNQASCRPQRVLTLSLQNKGTTNLTRPTYLWV